MSGETLSRRRTVFLEEEELRGEGKSTKTLKESFVSDWRKSIIGSIFRGEILFN